MIIKRPRPDAGIFFAIWPRWTPEGWACMEWLHYQWWDHGLEGGYQYARFIPDERYDAGERRRFGA